MTNGSVSLRSYSSMGPFSSSRSRRYCPTSVAGCWDLIAAQATSAPATAREMVKAMPSELICRQTSILVMRKMMAPPAATMPAVNRSTIRPRPWYMGFM